MHQWAAACRAPTLPHRESGRIFVIHYRDNANGTLQTEGTLPPARRIGDAWAFPTRHRTRAGCTLSGDFMSLMGSVAHDCLALSLEPVQCRIKLQAAKRSHEPGLHQSASCPTWHPNYKPGLLARRSSPMTIRDILFPMLSYPTATTSDNVEIGVALAAGFGAAYRRRDFRVGHPVAGGTMCTSCRH
jgi:hypothetical protein